MKTADYLQELKTKTRSGSLYAAAKLIGMPETTVRTWQRGRSLPDALGCLKIAEALDLPWEIVLTDIEAEREKDPERRAVWEELRKKLKCSDRVAGSTARGNSSASEHFAHTLARIEQSTNYATRTRLQPRAARRSTARTKPARCGCRTRATNPRSWGSVCNGHTRAAAAGSPCDGSPAPKDATNANR